MRGWCLLWLTLCVLAACESAPAGTVAPSPAAISIAATNPPDRPPLPSPATVPQATATLPPRPERWSEVPRALLDYLNADPQNLAGVRPLLAAWGVNTGAAPLAGMGDAVVVADIDLDLKPDLLVALAPAEPDSCEFGAVVLYLRDGPRFRVVNQIGLLEDVPIDPRISHVPCPKIFAVRDLLNDNHNDVILTSTTCGAHTCTVTLEVLRWDGTQLRSIMTQPPPSMAFPEIAVVDTGRGALDIVLHGGVIGSLGAGPQRERRETYRWNGTRFALAQTLYDSSNYLYFKVVDANALMRQGQLTQAIALYQQALSNPALELSGLHPDERDDLQAFSRFRMIVAYALLGDREMARSARDDLSRFNSAHIYRLVGDTFFGKYALNEDVESGCLAVTALATTRAEITDVLSNFGYANPDLTPDDVCPFR